MNSDGELVFIHACVCVCVLKMDWKTPPRGATRQSNKTRGREAETSLKQCYKKQTI